jgi:hypothetical protein
MVGLLLVAFRNTRGRADERNPIFTSLCRSGRKYSAQIDFSSGCRSVCQQIGKALA